MNLLGGAVKFLFHKGQGLFLVKKPFFSPKIENVAMYICK